MSTRTTWRSLVTLNSECIRDLRWFADLPAKWDGRPIWRSPANAVLHSDASLAGWGGVLNNYTPAHGFWRAHQRAQHINVLELRSVRYTVERFVQALRGRNVLLWEDNQVVCQVLTTWTSRSRVLMHQVRKLWWLLDILDVTLHPIYIRGAANIWADSLSRLPPRCCITT